MKFLKIAAPISVLLMSLSVFATTETKVTVVEKMVVRDSSEHNRMKISNSIMAQLVGAGPSGGSSSGIIFTHYFDSNHAIQFEVLNARSNWNTSSTWGSTTNVQGNNVAAHYKQFNGNSFYFKTGIDYSTIDYKYDYVSSFSSAYNDGYSFKGSKVSASFAIGNQWQWENFTMGCDWIGWSTPITHSSSDEVLYGDDRDMNLRSMRNNKETYLERGYPLALHFYLGASF